MSCRCHRLPRVSPVRTPPEVDPPLYCLEGPPVDWSRFGETGVVRAERCCRLTGLAWTLSGSSDSGRIDWSYHLADESLERALEMIEAGAMEASDQTMVELLDRLGRPEQADGLLRAQAACEPRDEVAVSRLSQRLEERQATDELVDWLLELEARAPLPDHECDRLVRLFVALDRAAEAFDPVVERLARYRSPSANWTPNEPRFVTLIPRIAIDLTGDRAERMRAATIEAARAKAPSIALPFAWAVLGEASGEGDDEPYRVIEARVEEFRGFAERPFWDSVWPPIDDGLADAWDAVRGELRRRALAEPSERLLQAMAACDHVWDWSDADIVLADVALPGGLRGLDVARYLVEDGRLLSVFENGRSVWRLPGP